MISVRCPTVRPRYSDQRLTSGWGNTSYSSHRPNCIARALPARGPEELHLQLATAKLPSGVNVNVFADQMYQWASTLTQSGANLPFVLPLKADKIPTGFQISLLSDMPGGGFASAADILATVEQEPGVGEVFFVRFYEGPSAFAGRSNPPPAGKGRCETLLKALPDVDAIMQTMPRALKKAVTIAS